MLLAIFLIWAGCAVIHVAAMYVCLVTDFIGGDEQALILIFVLGIIFSPLAFIVWAGVALGEAIKNNYFGG